MASTSRWVQLQYLNAGPGTIGGLYVREEHFDLPPAMAGEWGNADDTQLDDREPEFEPARGASEVHIGTVARGRRGGHAAIEHPNTGTIENSSITSECN